MIAQLAGMFADDIYWPLARLFGKQKTTAPPYPFNSKDPWKLINAINNPGTRESGIARMHKLGYGRYYSKTGRMSGAVEAEHELMTKGVGPGGIFRGRPMKGFSQAFEHAESQLSKIGIIGALGTGLFQAATAPKGHKLSSGVAGVAGMVGFGIGDVVGTALLGPLFGFGLGAAIQEGVDKGVGESLQFVTDTVKQLRHVHMGGDYEDTEAAYTMRQKAAQEMGSSVLNARQWLGKESILMHQ